MAKNKADDRSFAGVIAWLRGHGFSVTEAARQAALTKYGCSAVLTADEYGDIAIAARPGLLLGGELAALVDKGYQKVFKTSKLEVAATAEHLRNLHQFAEELREAIGATSLYNEALGTVSDRYVYDRVKDRDNAARPVRPWEARQPS